MKKISFGVFVIVLVAAIIFPANAAYVACYNGTDATIGVNWTFTGANGTMALVTNVGTPSNALLDFIIPAGNDGAPGSPGAPGAPGVNGTNGINGTNATITVNATLTGAAGSSAIVTNVGTASAASFDFTIPRGYNGTDGASADSSQYLFLNGTRAMTGNLNMSFSQIIKLITGTTGDTATNKTYVDSVNTSMKNYVDALPASNYNASYVTYSNTTYVLTGNTSYVLTSNTTYALDSEVTAVNDTMRNYVNATNTSMKNYVDGRAAPDLTPFLFINGTRAMTGNLSMGSKYINGVITGVGADAVNRTYVDSGLPYVASGNQSIILAGNTSFVASTNASLVTTGNTTYVLTGGSRAMTGNLSMGSQYINSLVSGKLGTDAVNKSYVDSVASTYNATYDAKTNYNASYWTGTNYNSSYWTGTNYNSSYWTGTNYNATYDAQGVPDLTPFLFINGTRAMTGNLSMGSRYINGVITGVGTDAVNRTYVDSGLPYVSATNASIILAGNGSFVATTNASLVLVGNTSYILTNGQRAMAANLSMGSYYINNVVTGSLGTSAVNRSYVDAGGLPYVAASNASLLLTTNTSVATTAYVNAVDHSMYLFLNGTRGMTGNLTMGGKSITGIVTGVGADAVNRTYVDSGLPYVTATNQSIIVAGNTSFVQATNASLLLTSNSSIATTTYVASVNTSMKNYVDGQAVPDLTPFLFINGTRAMTGNLSMGSKYINNVVTGTGTDAVNRTYVDSGLPYISSGNQSIILAGNTSFVAATNSSLVTTGNATYVLTGGSRAMTGNLSMGSQYINSLISGKLGTDAVNKSYVDSVASTYNATYDAKTNYNASYWTGTNYNSSYMTSTYNSTYDAKNNYNASYWTGTNYNSTYDAIGTPDLTPFLFLNGTRAMTGNLSMNSKYINSVITGNLGTDAVNRSYIDAGLPYVASSNQSIILAGNTSFVGTTNASLVLVGNTSYILNNGQRAMAANLSMGSYYINNLITGTPGASAVNRTYVDSGLPYVTSSNTSIITAGNTSFVATTNSTLVLTSNTSYLKNPVFGYLTLMAGSAMVTTTNPTSMNQWETTTNKNNLISINFTDGGSEVGMWIVDLPADWNSSANVIFTPIWTARAGTASQTVHFDIFGKLFPDDAALDTALSAIGDSQDSYIASGDLHVAPETTGAAISSVGTGGNTAIIKVTRDSATDNLGGTAELIGLRIKYARILS